LGVQPEDQQIGVAIDNLETRADHPAVRGRLKMLGLACRDGSRATPFSPKVGSGEPSDRRRVTVIGCTSPSGQSWKEVIGSARCSTNSQRVRCRSTEHLGDLPHRVPYRSPGGSQKDFRGVAGRSGHGPGTFESHG